MSQQEKKTVAAKPVAKSAALRKPPKKLVPRPAEPIEVVVDAVGVDAEAAVPAASEPVAKARPARQPSQVEVTVAKHRKVLAEALVKAQAIKYDQPKMMKPEAPARKSGKAEKPAKAKKVKLIRDSYAMPEAEYARIAEMKKRLAALGSEVRKSELLRGGIALLAALDDAELKAVMSRVEPIKTGRPAKK